MSLSDYLKYLRAVKGGLTPWEISEATGVPSGTIHLLEVKHRRMGEDEAVLAPLAEFYGVPLEELTSRRDAYRKRLTLFLDERCKDAQPVALRMESGDMLEGAVSWYSREALALQPSGETQPFIVQRAWVADWRLASESEWQVSTAQS